MSPFNFFANFGISNYRAGARKMTQKQQRNPILHFFFCNTTIMAWLLAFACKVAPLAMLLLLLLNAASAFGAPKPHTSFSSTTQLQSQAPANNRLCESELLDLISDDAYAMDISSITEGTEKETYIGQGSGVNEGTGIGALASWLQAVVGKILTWKNRPIYDKLWTVIEDDLLAMVQQKVPELTPRPTWFSSLDEPYSFSTDDGKCQGTVAAYKGGRVDWVTTCKFFSQSLGFGNMRIDGWSTRDTRAPHMAVHLCIVFNVIFIYISLVPRSNLLLDDEYNDYGAYILLFWIVSSTV
jgi:hypothetical protein